MTKRLVILTVTAMTFAALLESRSLMAATPMTDEDDQTANVFYTVSSSPATGASELFAIKVSGSRISTTNIGPMGAGGCGASLALSPSGTLLTICGPLFGTQQLSSVDTKTGLAHPFGVPVPGLAVMSMTFAPNGVLYAIGDCNPNGAYLDCGPGPSSDPNYNSLYTVNEATGVFTRFDRSSSIFYGPDV